jgi:nicotinamide riboside transporter PnuC
VKKIFSYFSRLERILWASSVALILLSFLAFDRANFLALIASLIGVTSLIYSAKGNPIGQALMVAFSLLYGIISYTFAYFGEMITYLGMTMPMAILALIAWLRNPYKGNRAEVKVNRLGAAETALMWAATACVTAVFYFVLRHFHTQISSQAPSRSQRAFSPFI